MDPDVDDLIATARSWVNRSAAEMERQDFRTAGDSSSAVIEILHHLLYQQGREDLANDLASPPVNKGALLNFGRLGAGRETLVGDASVGPLGFILRACLAPVEE
ncbi:MAG TPA: hypothetical protein PLX89_12165 [Verrucomicrobiota bacterium]|nr:hypothetical protein [Verrucomicrobiales bacterium]HRI13747.1 hypothetical protein [Verrucomicrobiota bacterium]